MLCARERIRYYECVGKRNRKTAAKSAQASLVRTAKPEPRYASREMMGHALRHVMEIHGEAFRKLAK
jgi:hypothetical protein